MVTSREASCWVGPRSGLMTVAVVAIALMSACGTPVGNNGKPVGLTRVDSRWVIFVPLCPGERISYVDVAADGYDWEVSAPVNARTTKIVVGDHAAFRRVERDTIPKGGAGDTWGSGDVLVSVSTSWDTNRRYRFQDRFHLKVVGTGINGGEAFDYEDVSRANLEAASNC